MRGGGNRVYRDPRVDTPWRCRGRLGLARGVLPAGLARSRAHKTTQLVDATYPNLPYTYTYTYTYTYPHLPCRLARRLSSVRTIVLAVVVLSILINQPFMVPPSTSLPTKYPAHNTLSA